jgi:hypothetical protein
MHSQLDGSGGERRSERFNESLPHPKAPEAPAAIAPRIRKPESAHLAVQRAAAWRHERIATAAYYLAEKRGFAPGHEVEDWRLAEAQVDATDSAI